MDLEVSLFSRVIRVCDLKNAHVDMLFKGGKNVKEGYCETFEKTYVYRRYVGTLLNLLVNASKDEPKYLRSKDPTLI